MVNLKKRAFILILVGLLIVAPTVVSAQSPSVAEQIREIQAKIVSLQAQLVQLQQQDSTPWCHTFNTNLKIGDFDNLDLGEVYALHEALKTEGFSFPMKVTLGGLRSFGEDTAVAVTGFQEKYRSEILTPLGLKYGTGYVGPSTRTKLNRLYGCGGGTVQSGWLDIRPSNFSLQVGRETQVQAFYQPPMPPCPTDMACGQVMPASYPIQAKFSSSNPNVVAIDGEAIADCFTDAGPTCFGPFNIVSIKGISNGTAELKAVYNLPSGSLLTATTNVTVTNGTTVTPQINSIYPQSGPVGTQVNLTGSGFSTDIAYGLCPGDCSRSSNGKNTLHFGLATISGVISYDGKILTFSVPDGYTPPCTNGVCRLMEGRIVPGTYNVSVTNANGTSNIVSFTVTSGNLNSSVQVFSPNGGETWQKGTTQTITWKDTTLYPSCPAGAQCAPPATKYYDIELVPYYPPCTGTICPMYPYRAPYTIASGVFGSSYSWPVGMVVADPYGNNSAPDGAYTVQVCQTGTSICDSSDSYFKI